MILLMIKELILIPVAYFEKNKRLLALAVILWVASFLMLQIWGDPVMPERRQRAVELGLILIPATFVIDFLQFVFERFKK